MRRLLRRLGSGGGGAAQAAAAPAPSAVPPRAALAAARLLSGAGPARVLSTFAAAAAAEEVGGGAAQPARRDEPAPPPAAPAGPPAAMLAMIFTCGRCNTRAAKTFSRNAYENGVVLVECPGCDARHLVSDRKGWFGQPGSIENFMAERGELVTKRGGAGEAALELTAEELAGASLVPVR